MQLALFGSRGVGEVDRTRELPGSRLELPGDRLAGSPHTAPQTLNGPRGKGRVKGPCVQNGHVRARLNRTVDITKTRPRAGIFRNGETRNRTGDYDFQEGRENPWLS